MQSILLHLGAFDHLQELAQCLDLLSGPLTLTQALGLQAHLGDTGGLVPDHQESRYCSKQIK